jgi:hypothetical protein
VSDEPFATYPVLETFDRADASPGPIVFILRAGIDPDGT